MESKSQPTASIQNQNIPSPDCQASDAVYRLGPFSSFRKFQGLDQILKYVKAGFYYVEHCDCMQCFRCGNCVSSFDANDKPRLQQWHKPNCNFCGGEDCDNNNLFGEASASSNSYASSPASQDNIQLPNDQVADGGPTSVAMGLVTSRYPVKVEDLSSIKSSAMSTSSVSINQPQYLSTASPESRAASPETQQQKKKARLPINELDCFDSPLSTLEKAEKQDLYPCQEPKHPSLVYFNERLVTLRDVWPAVNSLSCVNEVANAGFFYCGVNNDRVCCWYCGYESENWARNSTAWEMHARLNPRCHYLLRNRSVSFISNCQPATDTTVPSDILSNSTVKQKDVIDVFKDGVRRAMESDMALLAHSMGFEERHIKQVMRQQIEENLCSFQTLEELLEALLTYERDLIDMSSSDGEESLSTRQAQSLIDEPGETQPLSSSDEMTNTTSLASQRNDERASDELSRFMECELALDALVMGFTEVQIRNVVKQEIKRTSRGFQTMLQLINALLASDEILVDLSDEDDIEEPVPQSSDAQTSNLNAGGRQLGSCHVELDDVSMPAKREQLRRLEREEICINCKTRERSLVFVPCGHIACCNECGDAMTECFVCRGNIEGRISFSRM
ncbi:putative inhibitor of apoptosis [Clavelina lepadiformis]|uniref:putative inhibitor of apoptosis n=1 Tax=Clavelina lepadiformis TaxID=159417 RepID=UPI0040412CEC